MYIVIVGAGNLGFFLANKLLADKHRVCFIEKASEAVRFVAQNSSIPVVLGDATQPEILKEARLEKADTFVALTSEDEVNIISCQLAKELFKVRRTVAKVNNPRHLKVFTSLGIDAPVDSTSILSRIVEEEASFTDFMNLLSIKKGNLSIVRLDLPENSPAINRKIKDIKLPPDTVLVSILREGEVIIPKGETELLLGDEIIGITSIDREKELINSLLGKL
ncbi:MAG TPA: TrkA family potassium uptake protein [Candidatus Omnitrophica bacterium]|nr:MAG: TrkA family potassium uptake protein [Candidatus Omnitrophota bacterium]RKY35806.1 MAG: TrkA family potassium uptake protein [Candidatus Omnitrophota bacterium]RKY44654.1 MAG: TrkA family potassium uptake protein [Candidatus Omnitrophota bacterium]HEC70111.1 TrkA family potassium uptake protein [Candidatus Omnitrophota bacterium]